MTIKNFLTTGEAAAVLNISRSTISRKFDRGVFQGKKNPITGERMVGRESLEAFAKQFNLQLNALAMARKKILVGTPEEEFFSSLQKLFADDERIQMERVAFGGDVLIGSSKEHPDLLILDEDLPDIACAEVIRSLRRMEDLKEVKILCFTKSRNAKRCVEWGADEGFTKGAFDEEAFRQCLYTFLDVSKESAETERTFEHQRRWPRINVSLPAKLSVYPVSTPYRRDPGEATVENVSMGGMFLSGIKLEKGVLPGEAFRFLLEVDHPPLKNWRAHCKVVRLQADESLGAGVQFVRLSKANRKLIGDMYK